MASERLPNIHQMDGASAGLGAPNIPGWEAGGKRFVLVTYPTGTPTRFLATLTRTRGKSARKAPSPVLFVFAYWRHPRSRFAELFGTTPRRLSPSGTAPRPRHRPQHHPSRPSRGDFHARDIPCPASGQRIVDTLWAPKSTVSFVAVLGRAEQRAEGSHPA